MKKIIVTGGSGFIGSNLVNFLIKKKYFVINIDKLSYSSSEESINELDYKNYSFEKIDITETQKIKKIIEEFKPDGIFNLAAETHVDRSIDSPEAFIQSNINGTFVMLNESYKYWRLLPEIKRENFRFIQVSTDEVYGDLLKGRSDENYSYKPSSPYSATKAGADHLIKSYIRTYNLSALISNCCNNYGPNQFPEKLIPKLIFNILHNKPLPIYGHGKNSREWIYVQDHCEALLLILLKGKLGHNYNIGSGQNIKNVDIAKKLLGIAKRNLIKNGNKVKISFVKDRPGHDFRYALNSKKIFKELKWKSKIPLNKGLIKTFNWYKTNKSFFSKTSKKQFDKRLGLKI